MLIARREVLKGAAAAAATALVPAAAEARHARAPEPEAVGLLFDGTRCVGCRACQAACKAANQLPPDRVEAGGGVYDAPADLTGNTMTIVKAVDRPEGLAFVKQQCMHCVDPPCASACMLGALHKAGEGPRRRPEEPAGSGIVVYDPGLCTGCRYCQIACPFNVPRFQWRVAFPRIVKCELCRHRADPARGGPYAVANPACAEACPRGAVIYGRRADLLEEAHRRLAAEPARYSGRVYGERDGGGTQALYLAPAGLAFDALGLPRLPERSAAQLSESVSHAPYAYGLTPIVLYGALALVVRRNQRRQDAARPGEPGEEEP